jgi:MYXO-CTERM domain-containing protein
MTMAKLVRAAGLGAVFTASLIASVEGCVSAPREASGRTSAELSSDGGTAPSRSQLVVSQIYVGGGTAGATLNHDFVELLNRSAGPLLLDGLSLQYANASDDFGAGAGTIVPLAGTLDVGEYALVQLGSSGTDGADLPTADLTAALDLDSNAGKVALAPSTDPLGCGGAVGSRCATTKVLDLVGYGALVSDFEGTQPVLPLTNAKAAVRAGNGCTDANDNRADFSPDTPKPRNSASAAANCPQTPPPPAKEAGGPTPPVVDPPLGPEPPGLDDGGNARDAGKVGGVGADSGCAMARSGADAPEYAFTFAFALALAARIRRRARRAVG